MFLNLHLQSQWVILLFLLWVVKRLDLFLGQCYAAVNATATYSQARHGYFHQTSVFRCSLTSCHDDWEVKWSSSEVKQHPLNLMVCSFFRESLIHLSVPDDCLRISARRMFNQGTRVFWGLVSFVRREHLQSPETTQHFQKAGHSDHPMWETDI